ncbi:Uncharacterised protein [Streptococcus pneumoniae]|nr:Uncharacterised protein [Streptococcus pneumoniae]
MEEFYQVLMHVMVGLMILKVRLILPLLIVMIMGKRGVSQFLL